MAAQMVVLLAAQKAVQMAALKAGCLVAKMVDHLVGWTAAHSAENLVVH